MTKLKYTGSVRGVTPMGKTMPQNLPRSMEANAMAQAVMSEGWIGTCVMPIGETELRVVAVMYDEITTVLTK